jgi:ubiquinone/menaquinone biosynthesis C-methylase UbiE
MADISMLQGRFIAPEVAVTHFHLREGDAVADFGAGKGNFAVLLARQVGPTGKVYACEIQKNLVETVADTARASGQSNIEAVWCDIEAHLGTKLADESLDAAILVNTLFQMEQKDVAIVEIHRTLRPGGKLFIIDWTDSFGGLGPVPEAIISENDTKALCESHQFIFERMFDAGDHHYGVAFRKP